MSQGEDGSIITSPALPETPLLVLKILDDQLLELAFKEEQEGERSSVGKGIGRLADLVAVEAPVSL